MRKCPTCGSHDITFEVTRYSERLIGFDVGGEAFEELVCNDCGERLGTGLMQPIERTDIHVGETKV